jgi:hypothetical protein
MQNPERFTVQRAIAAASLSVAAIGMIAVESHTPLENRNVIQRSEAIEPVAGSLAVDSCVSVICLDDRPPKVRPEPTPSPRRAQARASRHRHGLYPTDAQFELLAGCESTHRWNANTGNGYYGGLQDDLQTWNSNGGQEFARRPDLATRAEQIIVNRRIFHSRSASGGERRWTPWPACSRKLHLR